MKKIILEEARQLKEGQRIMVTEGNGVYETGTIHIEEQDSSTYYGVKKRDTLIKYDRFGFDNLNDEFDSAGFQAIYLLEEGDL